MNEKKLWNRIQENDNQAFREFFNLYYKTLCAYIMQFTYNRTEAEDIVQNTFIKLWIKRNKIQVNTSLKTYLFRSAYNVYIDELRKRKQNETLLEKLKFDAISSILDENDSLYNQKVEKLKNLVDILPERCKEILLMSKKGGLKNKEIAENLKISIKTVEAQIRIAFRKIRKDF